MSYLNIIKNTRKFVKAVTSIVQSIHNHVKFSKEINSIIWAGMEIKIDYKIIIAVLSSGKVH